ncbi:MAG: hypothetical protein IJQ37_01580 [Clostridia bacterium]|nr:hypothetical protein [Clostridia bacterium]
MKKRNKHILKAVIVSVIAVALFLTGVVSYAEYTKSSRAKRVIASYADSDVLFSSNYMSINTATSATEAANKRVVFTSATTQGAATDITICNFAQGNSTKYYSQDIEYTLSVKLVKVSGNTKSDITGADNTAGKTVTLSFNGENVTLDASSASGREHTFSSSTLDRRQASTDVCSVSFSTAFNDDENDIYLYITAELVGSYVGIADIDCLMATAVAHKASRLDWKGYFNEVGALADSGLPVPNVLDGFNYVISGVGATTLRLKWKTSAVLPSQVFTLGKTIGTDGEWSYVDFDVDSDTINRYDLQFYRVYATTDSFSTWATVKEYVVLDYAPTSGG